MENRNIENSVWFVIKPDVHNVAKDTANAIDAIEETLKSLADIAQMAIEISANRGDNTTNIPAEVATPFPPLKPSHIGYTCPSKQQKTAIRKYELPYTTCAIKVKNIPLAASPNSVKRAKILCPLRKTFVAPVLCEPTSLISMFP